MIFRLRKRFRFESSHQLMHHDGKCARLHGHSWTGFIEVSGHVLDTIVHKENMLMDYSDLGKIVKEIEATFDHQHLNLVLKSEMPTSELLALTLWQMVHKAIIELRGINVSKIVVNETCTSECVLEMPE